MRKQVWIGVVVTLTFGYFAFRRISFHEVSHALSQARLSLIGVALLIYMADFVLRSWRWSFILKPLKAVTIHQIIWVLTLGFFANNILPLRMGELARAHFAAMKLSLSRSSALGTIVIERLCDMVSFLLVFLVASTALPFPAYIKKGAVMMGIACLIAVAGLLLMYFKRQAFLAVLDRSPIPDIWKQKVMAVADDFTHSTIGILSGPVLVKALSLSVLIWTSEAGFLYFVAHALAVPISFLGAFFLLFALGLAVSLPQGPGYVGTFEFFGKSALVLLGFPENVGLPVIIAVHGIQFSVIAIGGLFALWKEKISFHSLSSTK